MKKCCRPQRELGTLFSLQSLYLSLEVVIFNRAMSCVWAAVAPTAALWVAGVVGVGVPEMLLPGAAMASPSKGIFFICGPGIVNGPPCSGQIPPRRNALVLAFLDWHPNPAERVGSFTHTLTYDPSQLEFRADASSLMCDLRSSSAFSWCPVTTPGSGTMGLSVYPDFYTIDQTGLDLVQGVDAAGLHKVTATCSGETALSGLGERNFLALAFDLVAPLRPGTTITYSPGILADSTLTTLDLVCQNDSGASIACGSDSPSMSLRFNNPVPAPLGLGGLSALFWQSRRLRRRLRSRLG